MKLIIEHLDRITAAIVIIGGICLRWKGIDSEIWAVVLIAVGWMFGGTYQLRRVSKK